MSFLKQWFYKFVVLFCLFTFSCKTNFSSYEIKKIFNHKEVKDLNKIRKFFIKELCRGEKNFKKCYTNINHDSILAFGEIGYNINFEKQKQLYNDLSDSSFKSIWSFCKTKYVRLNEEVEDICMNNGRYLEYLNELAKSNVRIANYVDRIKASGDIPLINMPYEVITHKKSYNLKDPNIQLLIAIHYLTINDQNNRHLSLRLKNRKQFNKN